MKFYVMFLAAIFCGVAFGAQKTAFTQREVRDPRQLETHLEANAADAQSRLASLEVTIGTNVNAAVSVASLTASGAVTGGSLVTTGAVTIAEGALTDSKIVSSDIKDGEIVNADISASAAIAIVKIATNSLGAISITFNGVDTTNVLHFSSQGILTNAVTNP